MSHIRVTKRVLRKDPATGMLYDDTLGLGKNVSVLAMGGIILNTAPEAEAIFDAFFAAGGTVVDTAYVYGKGEIDRLLRKWINSRGVREQIVVIAKGRSHPALPTGRDCSPTRRIAQQDADGSHRSLLPASRQPLRTCG